MAKRMTDTAKWDKAWFRKLRPEMKCLWIFLCDRCDHAGIWDIDDEAFEYFIGQPLSWSEIESTFGDKIQRVGADKLLISAFVEFQYGALNPDNRVHKSVIDRIDKLTKKKGLTRALQGSKDTDTDKDTDKDKEKEGECEGKQLRTKERDEILETIYEKYPRKEGKSPGMRTLRSKLSTRTDMENLNTAVDHYVAACKAKGRKGEFVLMWSTFANQWADWLDPSHGTSQDFGHSIGVMDVSDIFEKKASNE